MSNVDEICLMHEKVLRQQVRKQTLEEVYLRHNNRNFKLSFEDWLEKELSKDEK